VFISNGTEKFSLFHLFYPINYDDKMSKFKVEISLLLVYIWDKLYCIKLCWNNFQLYMYLFKVRERGPITFFTNEYFLCHYKGLFSGSRRIRTHTLYVILKLLKKSLVYAGHLEVCSNVVPNLPSFYDFYHIQLTFSFPQISLTFLGLNFG